MCPLSGDVILHNGEERIDASTSGSRAAATCTSLTVAATAVESTFDGPQGQSWDFTYNESLHVEATGDVVRNNGQSLVRRWTRNPDGPFTRAQGLFLQPDPGAQRGLCPARPGWLQTHLQRGRSSGSASGSPRQPADLPLRRAGTPRRGRRSLRAGDRLPVRNADRRCRPSWRASWTSQAERSPTSTTPTETSSSSAARLLWEPPPGNDFPEAARRLHLLLWLRAPSLNHNLLSETRPQEVATGGPASMSWTYGTDPGDPLTFDKVLTQAEGGTNASGFRLVGRRRSSTQRSTRGLRLANWTSPRPGHRHRPEWQRRRVLREREEPPHPHPSTHARAARGSPPSTKPVPPSTPTDSSCGGHFPKGTSYA